MAVLSDNIEVFIKELLAEEGVTDLQRNELASKFNCAPSQINYVLTTRFSPNRGYVIHSRRGGGGYIRIVRLNMDRTDYINQLIEEQLGCGINNRQAVELVEGLWQTGFIDKASKELMLAAVSDRALQCDMPMRNQLRASILKEILVRII